MGKSKLILLMGIVIFTLSSCRTQKELKVVTSESAATTAVSSMAVTEHSESTTNRNFTFLFDSLEMVVDRQWPTSITDSCSLVDDVLQSSSQRVTLRAFGGKVGNVERGEVSECKEVIKNDSVDITTTTTSDLQSSQDKTVIYDPPNTDLIFIAVCVLAFVLIIFIVWMKRKYSTH